MTRARVADHRSEAGTSLILALAMVTLISVALVSALGFATASLHSVSVIGTQRSTVYSADGAAQTAIQALRYNATAGTTAVGTACPEVDYAAVGTQPAVAVTCQVVASRPTGGPGATMPTYSILALGNSTSEAGISLTPTGTVKIAGPIASNSPAVGAGGINSVSAGTLDLSGYSVDAKGSCSGTVTVTSPGDKRCNTGQTYGDPGYPSQLTPGALPAANPAPTCAATNAVLQFTPGYYTNSAVFAPTSYTVGPNTCKTGYLYFQPGVYYFDFGVDPAFTSTVWTVPANQKIVGGQPNGWNPAVANSLPPAPGGGAAAACKTETNGGTAGVQFVFGGASHLNTTAAGSTMELCANPTPTGTNQQIAIYGQPTGSSPTPQTVTSEPTGAVPTPPSGGWSNMPTNVLPISPSTSTIDGQVASDDVSSSTTASVQLTGYPAANVPAGSTNVTYSLVVAHQETTSNANHIASLTATIGSCTPINVPYEDNKDPSPPVTDTIAVTDPACIAAMGSKFNVTFAVATQSQSRVTENLDGIDVVTTYTPPAVRAESGCIVTVGGCPLITVGTSTARLYVWGTVYAPLAAISANYVASGAFEFRRGVIARAVLNTGTPPADTTGGFCLGAGSPCVGPARVLLLTATVNGKVAARVLVRYTDAPALGFGAQILSWNDLR